MSDSFKEYWKSGEPFIWVAAGALALSLLLLVSLMGLIAYNGFGGFWPKSAQVYTLNDGSKVLGQVFDQEVTARKLKIKQGNRDLYGLDFRWLDQDNIASIETPPNVVLIDRSEWGNFFGFKKSIVVKDETIHAGNPSFDEALQKGMHETHLILDAIHSLEHNEIAALAKKQSRVLRDLRNLPSDSNPANKVRLEQKRDSLQAEFDSVEKQRMLLKQELKNVLVLESIDGKEKQIPFDAIHDINYINQLSFFGKIGLYFSRIYRFITEDPREANTEGGVFPAIFGTVLMVFIMSLIVTPLGVLAAIYLHEYAKPGLLVTLVRIAVNNLAGVPSIVFGVFGVGFFIYGIGSTIDEWFFAANLPSPTFGTGGILWASLTLALLTVPTVIVATEEGLTALPKHWREASYALGATKFETMARVVIPALTPAILTGMILAVARAAGEVAPLMITGVVKMAHTLPLDGSFPYVHMDRKFMHLGFHIYDLGFQSPNVDASRPMVYATTLLLLLLVIGLNSVAIVIRNRLNKKIHVGTI